MNKRILAQLEALVEQEVEDITADRGRMETPIMKFVLLPGGGLLQRLVNRQPNGDKGK
jgi:hypothetical protein